MARHLPNHFARTATVFALALGSVAALVGASQAAAAPVPQQAVQAAVPAAVPLPAAAILAAGSMPLVVRTLPAGATATQQTAQRRIEARRARTQAASLKVRHVRTRVVEVARKQLGDRYSAGGNGPDRFDCSGLTQYVFRVAAGKALPHQSHAQFSRVTRIGKAKAQPGDLVFFFRNGAHHVGIYIGHGHMIDARGYGEGVKVSPISGSWWGQSFSGIGRVLPAA